MTKKHFQVIAAVIARGAGFEDSERTRIAEALADEFAKFNPLFDRSRFLTACKVVAS
jgi:hypothetical protein